MLKFHSTNYFMEKVRNISVCLTPELFSKYSDKESIVVVIDILRATTVISAAFANGVTSVIPVETINEALKFNGKKNYIIAGERDGKKISNFNYSNSPYDYINNDVNKKNLVLTTTNGTKSIKIAKDHFLITASYINLDAVIEFLMNQNKDIILLCAGWKGMFNLEDTIFAGELSDKLLKSGMYKNNCDSLFSSLVLYNKAKNNLYDYLRESSHRKRLANLSMNKDVKFCLNPSFKSSIVPILNKDVIEKHL